MGKRRGSAFHAVGIAHILGRTWLLKWLPRGWSGEVRDETVRVAKTDAGLCEAPDIPGKSIFLREGLRRRELLETLLHESLHAAGDHLDEAWVDRVAKDLTRLVERFGRWEPAEGTPVRPEGK